mgnify:CR=1 FL=1
MGLALSPVDVHALCVACDVNAGITDPALRHTPDDIPTMEANTTLQIEWRGGWWNAAVVIVDAHTAGTFVGRGRTLAKAIHNAFNK